MPFNAFGIGVFTYEFQHALVSWVLYRAKVTSAVGCGALFVCGCDCRWVTGCSGKWTMLTWIAVVLTQTRFFTLLVYHPFTLFAGDLPSEDNVCRHTRLKLKLWLFVDRRGMAQCDDLVSVAVLCYAVFLLRNCRF